MMIRGDSDFANAVMRWFGEAVGGQKIQCRKRQEGRDGGVQTHDHFGGAERQSIFYTNGGLARGKVTRTVLCTFRLTEQD
jgi:hypothetical protein